jgi:tetratricopeptide (TPR) repeat protein
MTKAMTLAPSLWEANFSRGFYQFYFERDWREAGPHFLKAVSINPNSSLAQVYYGLYLAIEGRAEDAVGQTKLAVKLDPLSPLIHSLSSCAYLLLGRFDDSERAGQQALELQPGYLLAGWFRGLALSGLGRDGEAIEELGHIVTVSRAPMFVGFLGLAYARAGRLDDATSLLRELEDRASRGEYVPAFTRLAIYVGQGDLSAIRRTLSSVVDEATAPFTLSATYGPFLQSFRSDPEVDRLLSELYGL